MKESTPSRVVAQTAAVKTVISVVTHVEGMSRKAYPLHLGELLALWLSHRRLVYIPQKHFTVGLCD